MPRQPLPPRLDVPTLLAVADHLESARIYAWNNQARKVNGWGTAAGELRRLAAEQLEHYPPPPPQRRTHPPLV